MHQRRRVDPEAEVLREPAATRLLDRASQLDAALRAGTTVAELRAAAAEAGISAGAFDAALSELQQDTAQARLPDVSKQQRGRGRRWALAAAAAALIAAGAVAVIEMRAPAGVATPVVEQTLLLRCLSPEEAAELIRPLLDRTATVVLSPARAPRVLNIRATPEQIRRARSVLDQHEGAGSSACTPRPS